MLLRSSICCAACLATPLGLQAQDNNPETLFPQDYVRANTGQFVYHVPETLELANVVLVLTEWGRLDEQGNFFTGSDYHAAVVEHFGPFSDHPAVKGVNALPLDSFNDFIGFRENSVRFTFAGDTLRESSFLSSWWNARWLPDHFAALRTQIEDFARVSGFREFYARHTDLYDAETAEFSSMVDLPAIASWLEANFPVHYDSIRVFFSPLLRGNHSASIKSGNGFRQLSTVVAGPRMARLRSVSGGDLLLLRQLFTEIDHGYVDPVTLEHKDRVDGAFATPGLWYRDPQGFYATPFAAFNEYMTWGAMLLYIREHYPLVRYRLAREETVRTMIDSRGFLAFDSFFDELEALRSHNPTSRASDLYLPILDWAESHGKAHSAPDRASQ